MRELIMSVHVLLAMQFDLLLPPLYALVCEVEREELKGGRLLNLLHAKCHCGIPELQACMQRLGHNAFRWTLSVVSMVAELFGNGLFGEDLLYAIESVMLRLYLKV